MEYSDLCVLSRREIWRGLLSYRPKFMSMDISLRGGGENQQGECSEGQRLSGLNPILVCDCMVFSWVYIDISASGATVSGVYKWKHFSSFQGMGKSPGGNGRYHISDY